MADTRAAARGRLTPLPPAADWAWLQPAADLVRLGVFAGFVAVGLAAWSGRPRAALRLVAYVLGATFTAGLAQQEMWPFTTWALVHHLAGRRVVSWEMEARDGAGRWHHVDPAVLQPQAPEELGAWMLASAARLSPEGRARVAALLLARAEEGRRRFTAGGRPGRNGWLLGPLAAPYHFLPARPWRSRAEVPATPFVALRVWRLEWDREERHAFPDRVARSLLLETAAP